MSSEKKQKKKEETEVVEEVVEEEKEEEIEDLKEKNIIKIQLLIDELNRLKQRGGPDIRVCPKCFSLRVKEEDVLKKMGIGGSYPVCICQDCGWRSNKWIYLDRTMTKEERQKFLHQIAQEKVES